MDVNRTVLACGGGEKPIERPRARRTKETLFEPAGNTRRAALPLSPGAAARASMFLSHQRNTGPDLSPPREQQRTAAQSLLSVVVPGESDDDAVQHFRIARGKAEA